MTTKNPRTKAQANLDQALDFVQRAFKDSNRYPDDLLVLPLSSDVFGLFTPERVRLIQYLRDHGPVDSLSELAAKLHRDVAQVSRDVSRLEGVGLVRLESRGKSKRIVGTKRSILVA